MTNPLALGECALDSGILMLIPEIDRAKVELKCHSASNIRT